MRMTAVGLGLLVSLVAHAAPPVRKASGGERSLRAARQVTIEDAAKGILTVRTAPHLPVYLVFPEGFSSPPSCGACVLDSQLGGPVPADALFVLAVSEKENYLALKPLKTARDEGGRGPASGLYRTSVLVSLKSLPMPLSVEVAYGRPDEVDTLVQFSYAGQQGRDSFVAQQLQAERAKLERTFAERVQQHGNERLQRALLQDHDCKRVDEGEHHDLAVFEVQELCRFGRQHFLVFRVVNRGKAKLAVGGLVVAHEDGQRLTAVDNLSAPVFDPPHLRELMQGESVRGVVSFEVADGDRARSFQVRLVEDGGKNREVVVSRVGF